MEKRTIVDLPELVIENILSYLSYDEIAKNRIISKSFNVICMRMLNRGFLMVERRNALTLRNVKYQLPRRESERRYHPLARHCDILTSVETRISMLNMTYTKYIDSRICCFIPGRIIDEIRRVLNIVESSRSPPRAHEVLQELRDISSMAIEHFDEQISPFFRKRLQEGVVQPAPIQSQQAMLPSTVRQDMTLLRRRSILTTRLSLHLATKYKSFYKQMLGYKSIARKQQNTIRTIICRHRRQERSIANLKKRIEENDVRVNELIEKSKSDAAAVIAATATCEAPAKSQSLRHRSTQIRLDPCVMPIGTSRNNRTQSPNMKPRISILKYPVASEENTPPEPIPEPSTSNQPSKARSTMSKFRVVINQISQLTNFSKSFERGLKRPRDPSAEPDESGPNRSK